MKRCGNILCCACAHGPHLPLMVDLDIDLDLSRDRTEPSKLSLLSIVVRGVVGQLHGGDQQVVLLVRGVGA